MESPKLYESSTHLSQMSNSKENIGSFNPAQAITDSLQHQVAVGSSQGSTQKDNRLLTIWAGKPFPPPLIDPDNYVVEFDGPDDPEHPYNWSFFLKYAHSSALMW
jgi:DHA1 family multidrug resistance protein-like MFS transporter